MGHLNASHRYPIVREIAEKLGWEVIEKREVDLEEKKEQNTVKEKVCGNVV